MTLLKLKFLGAIALSVSLAGGGFGLIALQAQEKKPVVPAEKPVPVRPEKPVSEKPVKPAPEQPEKPKPEKPGAKPDKPKPIKPDREAWEIFASRVVDVDVVAERLPCSDLSGR